LHGSHAATAAFTYARAEYGLQRRRRRQARGQGDLVRVFALLVERVLAGKDILGLEAPLDVAKVVGLVPLGRKRRGHEAYPCFNVHARSRGAEKVAAGDLEIELAPCLGHGLGRIDLHFDAVGNEFLHLEPITADYGLRGEQLQGVSSGQGIRRQRQREFGQAPGVGLEGLNSQLTAFGILLA